MRCLLAPVPVSHAPDAAEIAATGASVAFGTDAFELLDHLEKTGAVGALPVYIVVSRTGFSPADFRQRAYPPGKVYFRGVLGEVCRADRRGRYPEDGSAFRPTSALAVDTPWAMFWTIADVQILAPPLLLEAFRTQSGAAWDRVPEGPVEAHLGQT